MTRPATVQLFLLMELVGVTKKSPDAIASQKRMCLPFGKLT
jgi:hypothetical protein